MTLADSSQTETWHGLPWPEVRETLLHWIRQNGVPTHVAEDYVQDCVADLLVRPVEIKTTARGYLRNMARNKVCDTIRTKRRKMESLNENLVHPDQDVLPDPRLVQLLRFHLVQFFRTADSGRGERKVPGCAEIMERTIVGETQFDIAKAFGCSRDAVAKAWERCKKAAREHFRSDPRFAPMLEWIGDV